MLSKLNYPYGQWINSLCFSEEGTTLLCFSWEKIKCQWVVRNQIKVRNGWMKSSWNLLHQLSLLFSSFSFSADFLPSICSSLSHPQNKNQPTHRSMSLSSYSPISPSFHGQASEKIGLHIPVPSSTFLTYSSPHRNLPTMSLETLFSLVTSSLFVRTFRFLNLALWSSS